MKNSPAYSQWIEALKKSADFPWCWHVFTSKISCVPMALKKNKSGILQLRDRGRDGVMIIFRPQTEAHQNGQVVIGTLWFLEHGWKIHSKNLHSVRMFNCHVWLPEGTCFFWILKDWNCPYMKTTYKISLYLNPQTWDKPMRRGG